VKTSAQVNNPLGQTVKRTSTLELLVLCSIISFSLWPSYLTIELGVLPQMDPPRVFLMWSVLYWLMLMYSSRNVRERFWYYIRLKSWLFVMLLFLFGWEMLSVFVAARVGHAFYSGLRDVIYHLVFFFTALTVWKYPKQIVRALKLLVYLGALISLIGMVEAMLGHNLLAGFVEGKAAYLIEVLGSVEKERDGVYRIAVFFANPLSAASYGVFVFPIVFFFSFYGKTSDRLIARIVMVLLLAMIWNTGSRGALVAILIISIGQSYFNLAVYINKYRGGGYAKVVLVPIFISAVVMAIPIVSGLIQGANEKQAGSTEIRLLQLELGVPLVMNRPLLGYGPGEAAEVLGVGDDDSKTVDNYFLSIALESGFPGLLMFIVLQLYFIRLSWRLGKKLPAPYSGLASALFFSLLGNFIFMSVLSLKQVLPLVFMVFSMLLALERIYISNVANTNNVESV